jgi:hypothetical protein
MTTKITEQNISELANAGVNWQSVVTADGSTGLTAVAGRGYFIDTTSGAQTVTLPASPNVGDVVVLKDYARTWGTNNVAMASTTFDGVASQTPSFSTNGQTVTLVYMDNTKGWSLINEDTTTPLGALFVAATGGTVATSGDFKIHSFTGDGCFVVSCAGNPAGSTLVSYMVVAGGGAGCNSGGGGGGGFREGRASTDCFTASPLVSSTGITVSATTYPIVVGAGGSYSTPGSATSGSNSVFSTITSAGGGYGGGNKVANDGGSGGGGTYNPSYDQSAGSGNTPPTSPPQGNPGQGGAYVSGNTYAGGGGGGATTAGVNHAPNRGGDGGAGATTSISGTSSSYAGGGGGKGFLSCSPNDGLGGSGGGANSPAQAGTANTGGGGSDVGNGGKGIVIVRYKFQK